MQNGSLSCTIVLHLRKVCYKVSLCEYCQRQSGKTFTGLLIRAKMDRGGRPLLREQVAQLSHGGSVLAKNGR